MRVGDRVHLAADPTVKRMVQERLASVLTMTVPLVGSASPSG
jgi:hypothetical protein